MSRIALGPVEFVVVTLAGEHPSARMLEALLDEVEAGAVRLLDFVVVHRGAGDRLDVLEVAADEFALAGLPLGAPGLAAEEDIRTMSESIPVGRCGAIIVVDLLWERRLTEGMSRGGALLVASEHVPASVANAALDRA